MARMLRCTICDRTHKPLYALRYRREFKQPHDRKHYIDFLKGRGVYKPVEFPKKQRRSHVPNQ